jgi:16S rRNA C1402 N4-methylase RsmH
MKVMFLDHDGVICLSSEWGGRYKKKGFDSNPETPMDIRMDNFNDKAVKVLNRRNRL